MDIKTKIAGVVVAILALFGIVPVVSNLGSIQDGHAYTASTTNSAYANTKVVMKLGSGTLGSVIITGTSATVVELRNATSSTDVGSTSIATFAASAGTGTYTFDSAFDRGLVVNSIGSFAGQYTYTYR
jgi:hypothetical protein